MLLSALSEPTPPTENFTRNVRNFEVAPLAWKVLRGKLISEGETHPCDRKKIARPVLKGALLNDGSRDDNRQSRFEKGSGKLSPIYEQHSGRANGWRVKLSAAAA
jgi:hypothetical protein